MSAEWQEQAPLQEILVTETLSWVGHPASSYRGPDVGQTPDNGFDCSGFVLFVLRQSGIPIPDGVRHANELFDKFGVLVQEGLQKEGDLVFFSKKGLAPKHVGIMITQFHYVHSPGKDGRYVMVSTLNPGPIKVAGEEALYNRNPIGFKRPSIPQGRWNKLL